MLFRAANSDHSDQRRVIRSSASTRWIAKGEWPPPGRVGGIVRKMGREGRRPLPGVSRGTEAMCIASASRKAARSTLIIVSAYGKSCSALSPNDI